MIDLASPGLSLHVLLCGACGFPLLVPCMHLKDQTNNSCIPKPPHLNRDPLLWYKPPSAQSHSPLSHQSPSYRPLRAERRPGMWIVDDSVLPPLARIVTRPFPPAGAGCSTLPPRVTKLTKGRGPLHHTHTHCALHCALLLCLTSVKKGRQRSGVAFLALFVCRMHLVKGRPSLSLFLH